MSYTIDYITSARPTGSEYWQGSFFDARELAEKAVATGCAERAEIHDAAGNMVFQHPRVIRRG